MPDPFTPAGHEKWTDHSVSVDVHFLSAAPATLVGRIDSADVFNDGHVHWLSGYVLLLRPNGTWELLSAAYGRTVVTLASGASNLVPAKWHRLTLRFHGKQIVAALDRAQLAAVADATHAHGMFALGSEWGRVQFHDLKLAP